MGNTSTKQQHLKAICALDFGTDGTALAFCVDGKVTVYNKWKASKRQRSTKTKTHILLNEKDQIVSFGSQAATIYSNLTGKEKQTWKFIDKFKMSLYGENTTYRDANEEENKESQVDISSRHQFKTEIDDYLTAVNDKLTNHEKIKDDEIQWIVTVPAIWTESSKNKMKQWFIKSGLMHKQNANQCKIVYEPDCAALAIHHDPTIPKPSINDRYILVDAGGGTVDVACHTITQNGHCTEFHSASGDKWGGSYIDSEYIKLLQYLFDKQWITEFQMESPNIYLEILNNFQTAKHLFFENSQNETHSIQLPYEFVQFLNDKLTEHNTDFRTQITQFLSGKYIQSLLAQRTKTDDVKEQQQILFHINSDEEILEMDVRIWKALFDSVVNIIIKHVQQLLNTKVDGNIKMFESVEYMYLCGGFATSKYLQFRMETTFGMQSKYKTKVLIPTHPTLTIVKGAAYFGIKHQYVTARRLRATYAVKTSVKLSYAKLHQFSEAYIEQNVFEDKDKIKYVRNCWKIVARKGDTVPVVGPLRPGTMVKRAAIRKKWKTQILRSDEVEPKTQNDFAVLANIEIPTAETVHASSIKSDVDLFNFYFGETMLRVEVHAGFSKRIQNIELSYNMC
eukprot:285585_1